ncbi:UNVERIFIED_CONTAM: hypothetical protein RMT77_012452 [Armadillidium vulgare]|nr:Small integral membrane protein 12 [Armadillidium vulgare]
MCYYKLIMLPWVWILRSVRIYAPYLMLPFAATIGVVGYNIESYFREHSPNQRPCIKDERNDRLLTEILESNSERKSLFSESHSPPKTIFDKNVSPSLEKDNYKDK